MSKQEPNIYRIITVCTCGKHNKYEVDLPKEPINALLIKAVEAARNRFKFLDTMLKEPINQDVIEQLEAALKGVRGGEVDHE